jgi:hypothetical protein
MLESAVTLRTKRGGSEPEVDAEPSLGWYDAFGQFAVGGGACMDDAEPPLGSTGRIDQRRWSAGESLDLEASIDDERQEIPARTASPILTVCRG